MPHYFAHGKLMISGEYAVLRGASALALPTKLGQHLEVSATVDGLLWRSLDHAKNEWFTAQFTNDLILKATSNDETAMRLHALLRSAKKLNPDFNFHNCQVTTTLEFNPTWGFGSSSTLVALVAQWANCNGLDLFFDSQTGSGYDVACAMAAKPIIYTLQNQKPEFKTVPISWPFADQLLFVHLGKKQNSAHEVFNFKEKPMSAQQIAHISDLTEKMAECTDLSAFEALTTAHENAMSKILDQPAVKETRFADYPHAIKSLGAWGGDFVLAVGTNPLYFHERGYDVVLPFTAVVDIR